ncbi:unnamed protein product [Dovyalis caffra]|uniref:Transmembrane protein n=1 Tax=Dovyalis caffra TaxID=77055 RepID=A0AAV1SHH9_9ROSI|nr:unnamed protein product [Dovyalis caffra]
MGVEDSWDTVVSPPITTVVPSNLERDDHWRHFDNSVNAVSFGFVATAILISMFLVMAIFERFLRPRSLSSSGGANGSSSSNDIEAQAVFHGKLDFPSPKMTVYAKGVSVLMPGDDVPTFLAHPAPVPCPPEHIDEAVQALIKNATGANRIQLMPQLDLPFAGHYLTMKEKQQITCKLQRSSRPSPPRDFSGLVQGVQANKGNFMHLSTTFASELNKRKHTHSRASGSA